MAEQALGDLAAAEASLRDATRVLRRALGERHPDSRRAAAAWARLRAQGADPDARRELEMLARPHGSAGEAVLASIRAGAYLAEASCQSAPSAGAIAALAALRAPLTQWQPEGGALTREVDAIEAECRREP